MNKHNLDHIRVLLADADAHIARIVMGCLQEMGFKRIHHVRTATEALIHISAEPIDILITEWLLKPMNGIELVQHLRLGKKSPNRGLPIIMLTGKGEMVDVTTARDVGITEFLVKPFTVQALYDRLVHLVDHPRPFVMSENFVGPDRRRRATPNDEGAERRKIKPQKIDKPIKQVSDAEALPVILSPDDGIKRTIGISASLSTIITPNMLKAAQNFLNGTQNENLQAVMDDLKELEDGFAAITKAPDDTGALARMRDSALAIKSRSGTFGFLIPSRIARILYLFLEGNYISAQKIHNNVVQQCLESLKVVFASDPKGHAGLANKLVEELEQLVIRVAKP